MGRDHSMVFAISKITVSASAESCASCIFLYQSLHLLWLIVLFDCLRVCSLLQSCRSCGNCHSCCHHNCHDSCVDKYLFSFDFLSFRICYLPVRVTEKMGLQEKAKNKIKITILYGSSFFTLSGRWFPDSRV